MCFLRAFQRIAPRRKHCLSNVTTIARLRRNKPWGTIWEGSFDARILRGWHVRLSTTCATACNAAGGGAYYVGASKTTNYCPTTAECQFNHVMWYTTKLRYQSAPGVAWKEDGNQISPQSSTVVLWNSYVK